jgi:hypothetical protein
MHEKLDQNYHQDGQQYNEKLEAQAQYNLLKIEVNQYKSLIRALYASNNANIKDAERALKERKTQLLALRNIADNLLKEKIDSLLYEIDNEF